MYHSGSSSRLSFDILLLSYLAPFLVNELSFDLGLADDGSVSLPKDLLSYLPNLCYEIERKGRIHPLPFVPFPVGVPPLPTVNKFIVRLSLFGVVEEYPSAANPTRCRALRYLTMS